MGGWAGPGLSLKTAEPGGPDGPGAASPTEPRSSGTADSVRCSTLPTVAVGAIASGVEFSRPEPGAETIWTGGSSNQIVVPSTTWTASDQMLKLSEWTGRGCRDCVQ